MKVGGIASRKHLLAKWCPAIIDFLREHLVKLVTKVRSKVFRLRNIKQIVPLRIVKTKADRA